MIILAPNKVDERDKDVTLEKKLQADEVKAAIFNWMYEGYRSFVKNEGKVEVASSVKALVEEMKENANSLQRWISTMGYWAAPDPQYPGAPGWKSLKEWIQEYIKYCQDWGETPRSRSAVTEQFKKMGVVSKRRSDGVWYYMEPGAVEKEEKEEISADLPPIGPSEENLPF